MIDHHIRATLEQGMQALKLDFPCDGLLDYLALLHKWNKAYNLTAVRDLDSMVGRHILDSLAILPWLHGKHVLDVGTGAGLPGIPIAIARPDLNIVLLDSNGKKIRFLQEVKRALNLDNVEPVQIRVEDYQPTHRFDTITSRAFSDIQLMLNSTQHLIATDGIWLAMKGRPSEEELAGIKHTYKIEPYAVMGQDGERCCIIVKS